MMERSMEPVKLDDINVKAMLDCRDGITGVELANYLILQATREAYRMHPAGEADTDYRKTCRLTQEVWALRRAVQKVCDDLAAVVEPV